MTLLKEQLIQARVLPVLVIDSEEQAVGLCQALQAAGFTAVEITLRTPAALAAIKAVKQTLPALTVAAGTVITTDDMERVADASVDFAVSPGLTRALSDCARYLDLSFLPGVSTASEIIGGMELGHRVFKFFPAQATGGINMLKSLASPFAGISFCPTGGLTADNARSYLALGNVSCIGGSWMIDAQNLRNARWADITLAGRECLLQLNREEA